MYNLKYNIRLKKRFIRWDEIEHVTFYKGINSCLVLELADGSKEIVNIGAFDENAQMIYNAIAAYHTFFYDKRFDWNSIMRNETEKESNVRSILFSIGVFIASFLLINAALQAVERSTYSVPLYTTAYALEESSQNEIKERLRMITGDECLSLRDVNREKKAVAATFEDKCGVLIMLPILG